MSELESRIARVFGPVPRPDPDGLLHPDCGDPAPVEPFRDFESWQDVPQETLCYHYDALSFFSPAAFRFFLPAYMVATLRLYRTSTDFVSDATVFELDPHSEYAVSRYALFTPTESSVVVEFLERMASNPQFADARTARAALDGHWLAASRRPGSGGRSLAEPL